MRGLRARWLRSVALAAGLVALAGGLAQAQTEQPVRSSRVALVIGEGAYRTGPLPAAPNDAGLVAQVLAGAGFDVTGARDLDGDALRRAFRDFLDKAGAAGPDGIAVVYVAGRAVQSDGDDFIVPVDARLVRPADVPIEALRLADLTHALAALPIQARVVIVDGAYPGGPASSAPGLALAEAEQGELIAFNAAPGTVAPAASGPYGTYAQALVAAVRQGGVPVGEVFARVRLAVNQATGGAVVPWDSDKLTRSFTFFDRAPNAPAVASAQVPFAALEKRPLAAFPPAEAYDLAVARDTLPAYAEFLAAFPNDPLARRVRLILAVRREALFWRAALGGNTPGAYWTYLARYPKGPHATDARRRLTRLAAAAAPPPRFVPVAFDVPPPGPDDLVYDRVLVFDAPDLPPPPPPPVFLLPPPIEVVAERPPPPPPPGPALLPVPVPVAIPYVRPPVEPGAIAPPRGVSGGYARPRPYMRGPNGDGLVVQAAPAQSAPARPVAAPSVPAPPAPAEPARPRGPAAPVAPAPPAPQPSAASAPRAPNPPVPPSHALPVPPQTPAPSAPAHLQPGAKGPAGSTQDPVPPAPVASPPPPAPPTPRPRPSAPTPGDHRGPAPAFPPPAGAPAGASPTPFAPKPHGAGVPSEPRRPAAAPEPAPAAPAPPVPAARPRPPAAPSEPTPPRAAPHPAPERPPEPRTAAPASPPPPGRPAPEDGRPDRPAPATSAAHPGPERPIGEHRPACGHPGEPPCHP